MTNKYPDLEYHHFSGYYFAELPPEWKEPLYFDDYTDVPKPTAIEITEWLERQRTLLKCPKLTIRFFEDTDPTALDGSLDNYVYWFTRAQS